MKPFHWKHGGMYYRNSLLIPNDDPWSATLRFTELRLVKEKATIWRPRPADGKDLNRYNINKHCTLT